MTHTPDVNDLLLPAARALMGIRMEVPPAPVDPAAAAAAAAVAKKAEDDAAAAKKKTDDDAAAAAAAAAGTTPPPATGTPAAPAEPFDEARARATIARQRQSEDAAKLDAKTAREELDRIKRGEMTPEERQAADLKASQEREAAATRRANEATLFATLATRDDVADGEIARDLLIAQGLKFDEDGKPVDLESHLERLLEAKPILKKSGQGPAPTPTPGTGEGSPPPNANGAAGSGGQGPPPALSEDEVNAANAAGMSPERFASMKGGMSLADWEAQQKAEREKAAAGGS